MSAQAESVTTQTRELSLTRIINAPPEKVYRAWTEPELLKQWFAPRPWTTPHAELNVRLEVVTNERLVFTDAYTESWEPSLKPFMTVILTFEKHEGKTRYTARVRHWTVADR